jgi:hypothetical protein
MGLFGKALAVGFGYALAQPAVRQKLGELIQHPKVKQGRDQIQNLAADGLRTAKRQLSGSGTADVEDSAPNPPIPGVSSLPSARPSDRAALSEGVLPPAEDPGATTARKDF